MGTWIINCNLKSFCPEQPPLVGCKKKEEKVQFIPEMSKKETLKKKKKKIFFFPCQHCENASPSFVPAGPDSLFVLWVKTVLRPLSVRAASDYMHFWQSERGVLCFRELV